MALHSTVLWSPAFAFFQDRQLQNASKRKSQELTHDRLSKRIGVRSVTQEAAPRVHVLFEGREAKHQPGMTKEYRRSRYATHLFGRNISILHAMFQRRHISRYM